MKLPCLVQLTVFGYFFNFVIAVTIFDLAITQLHIASRSRKFKNEERICDTHMNELVWSLSADFGDNGPLKGLSHEIDFKNFDQNLKNLT